MASTPPVDQIITPPTGFTPSGTVQSSGTPAASSVFEGPHFVEGQSLLIYYWRVPDYALSTTTTALDSVAATFRVPDTHLIVQVNATYYTQLDYGNYGTSAWNQPLKFQFNQVSTDNYGNSYGALNASCLGPRGQIVPTQNYYNRVPYVGAVSGQVAGINRSVGGTNFYCIKNPTTSTSSVEPVFLNGHTDFEKYYHHWRPGSFLSDHYSTEMFAPYHDYQIDGPYATDTEDIYQIFQFINELGTRVTNSTLYSTSPAPTVNQAGLPVRDVGFSEYSILRHDYS